MLDVGGDAGANGREIFERECDTNLQSSTCNSFHDPCGMHIAEASERLAAAVKDQSASELATLVERQPKNTRIVPGRGVVQILDCSGAVVAQQSVSILLLTAALHH